MRFQFGTKKEVNHQYLHTKTKTIATTTMNHQNEAVLALELNAKAANTKRRYSCTNYKFLLYLFKNRSEYAGFIRDGALVELKEAEVVVWGGRERKYKHFRAKCIELLEATTPSAGNSPIDMGRVTYDVIATYLTSLKTEEDTYKGMSTYDGACSSIMHLMHQDNVYPDHKFQSKICNLLKGFKRTVQQQKVELGMSLNEGKDLLSFAGYNLLCRNFLKNNGTYNEFIFAHCFLTLEWNLMCRADNLVNLNLAHIGWEDDSLVSCIAKAKHDQEGEGAKTPWHIYANPSNPFVCPVLALGLYLFTHPDLLTNQSSFLFTGNHQYRRYTQTLKRAIALEEDHFSRLGVELGSFGSHSLRKGSSTFAASGSTMAPSMASICNCAGWKMGGLEINI